MALSQIQCLDDNHVNPRTTESKPEFLYCEDQRLALEAFLRNGREAFFKYLEARGLRGFLSDPELDALAGALEPNDPGSERSPPGRAEEDGPPLSLHYWPDLSDTSVPEMDLGWPDCDAYRGVTRTTVYSQPPLDGQTHIKEIVRKMIAQAQKVIAVVMDVFTDVDIFRDLLDAGFKRKVSVYILLERTTLPHFLSMCQRANMHAGHLKHLRVRCTGGAEFYTRSSTKVRGRMVHRFMFIDGDKAVSGSYSFTWMSSRLDKSLITVVTGQAVDAFDKLFRTLYGTSSSADFRMVPMEPAPEPEPLPQPTSVAPPSAAIARKLYNPKYALLNLGNSSSTASAGDNSPKETQSLENSKNPGVPQSKKMRQGRACKEASQEPPPIHPGLTNLEKACLVSYLPTWPEPDPPSDVIGFINIRDSSKPTQVHLQRSEMFETSQAIRFSSPLSTPKANLPEVAKPRQLTPKCEEINKHQTAQAKTKVEELVVDRAQAAQLSAGPDHSKSKAEAPKQRSTALGTTCESNKPSTKTLSTDNKLKTNTLSNQDAALNSTPHLSANTPPKSRSKASPPTPGRSSHTTQPVTANNPKPDSFSGSNAQKVPETSLNTQSVVVHSKHNVESNDTQTSHPRGPTDSNTKQHTTKTAVLHTDSHTPAAHTQPQNIQTPTINSEGSSSSTTCSENIHVSVATSTSTSAPLSSISPSSSLLPLTSSITTLNAFLPSSSAHSSLTSTPPIPKPRTIQLVIKDSGNVCSDGQKLPEFSVIRRPEPSAGTPVVHSDSAVATAVQKLPEKGPETVPELHNNSGGKTGEQKDAENPRNIGEAPQQIQTVTPQETKNEDVGLRDHRAGMRLVSGANMDALSRVLITDGAKAESVHIQAIIPKDVQPKTLTSAGCESTPQMDGMATAHRETKAAERVQTGCDEKSTDVNQCQKHHAGAQELERIPLCDLTPQDIGTLENVDSLNASTHTPVSASHNLHMSQDHPVDGTHTHGADSQGRSPSPSPGFTPAGRDTRSTLQEVLPKARGSTHAPGQPPRLHVTDTRVPDLRTLTPEREARSPAALIRTPTPDGFLPHTPTPDSRTHTPDPRSRTPEFRTPTSDVSDGCVSSLSTTSEEYYECSESPFHEPVCDRAAFRSPGTTEEYVSFTQPKSSNATTITISPTCMDYNDAAAKSDTTDRDTSSSETLSLSRPASVSSMGKATVNEESGREEDEKERNPSVAQRKTEGDPHGTNRRGSKEAKRTAGRFKQGKDSTEAVEKIKEAQSQALKRKKELNQSRPERLVHGGATAGELTNEGAEPKRLSTGDLKPKTVAFEGAREGNVKEVDVAALGGGGVERPQTSRQPEGQKQHNSEASSPSRPPRPLSATQPSGARPGGSRQLNQAESKAPRDGLQVSDITPPPRRPPSRPPPPVAAGWRQTEVSPSQQSLLSRQPPTAQAKVRSGRSPSQRSYPKPQPSFLHTHSNVQLQLPPHSESQAASAREAHGLEEGSAPFSFTFSRLYNLKGLKDKIGKLPAQSKRGSTSSAVERQKSTS